MSPHDFRIDMEIVHFTQQIVTMGTTGSNINPVNFKVTNLSEIIRLINNRIIDV